MQLPDSLLTGENAAFLDEQYGAWLQDPAAVDPRWREMFEGVTNGGPRTPPGPPAWPMESIFGGSARGASAPAQAASVDDGIDARVMALVIAHRTHGHRWAEIDPLAPRIRYPAAELDPAYHGIKAEDHERTVTNPGVVGLPERLAFSVLLERLRKVWCGSIGAEIGDIRDSDERVFVRQRMEATATRPSLDPASAAQFLRKISDAENFERTLATRFPGAKRFGLEGAEGLIPLLDLVVRHAAAQGATDFVVGMAHRGRLNTLVNLLSKPVRLILDEFQDVKGQAHGSGDVKYHLGFSADLRTVDGKPVHLTLTPNPSHLEAVDPVVEGRVRAKQDRVGPGGVDRVVPILLHGDAAFAGQGVVAEVLNLSELSGYRTGGTIHVVVNNQIGFTTPPADARSTPYATDMARMLGVPILHVNGEDPLALAAVADIAVAWRMAFHRDVVVDMYCYRKHGHNEADEPAFTQPKMYDVIRARPTPRENVAACLVRSGLLTEADVARIHKESQDGLTAAADQPAEYEPRPVHPDGVKVLRDLWALHRDARVLGEEAVTSLPIDVLRDQLLRVNRLPDQPFHPKVQRVFQQRLEMAEGKRPFDWGTAESAAVGSLLVEGRPVRLSGQDVARGTFTHRHAVVTDMTTEAEYMPLRQLGPYQVFDSSLSEYAVMGFEYGYSLDMPEGLVMWEAQFGDFVNGAQVLIDQYLTAAEQKWGRLSGLVLLLPHGYEGQGPEHSSARLERFLASAAEDNIQVAMPSTPASYHHLLRRQVHQKVRKPLVVMTPKALLRHPEAVSTLEELANGPFRPVIPDPEPPAQVDRLVFCSGKVYYDLLSARRKSPESNAALHRVELLYPLPVQAIRAILDAHPDAQVTWCQEEPKNMGAWPTLLHWWLELLPPSRLPKYAGRAAAAAPATGSYKKHGAEQDRLVREALGIPFDAPPTAKSGTPGQGTS